LFGHVRGAFTGATTHRDGAASMSDGGTLFLDEVCEMDLELQKKMLRFIQTGEYQRVGELSPGVPPNETPTLKAIQQQHETQRAFADKLTRGIKSRQ